MENITLKPGYFNKKPLLKTITSLRDLIGLQDSCIQTTQVALLYFEEEGNKSGDMRDFVKQYCKKYHISLGTNDYSYLKSLQYKVYILQTYNLLEPLLKQLNKDYKKYNNFKGKWITEDSDKQKYDPFNQFVENQTGSGKRKLKEYPEYHLLNYYRLIRVSVSHLQVDPKENKATQTYYDKHIAKRKDYFTESYLTDAPNEPGNISFTDFTLYTRAIKYFSNILNDMCFPSIDNLVLYALDDEALEKKLKPFRENNYKGKNLKQGIKKLLSFYDAHFDSTAEENKVDFWKKYFDKKGVDYSDYQPKNLKS